MNLPLHTILRYRCLAALLFTLIAGSAIAQIESTNLWNAGIGGYSTYRVPGIVRTKRGTLLAYCGGRRDLSKGDWSPTDILLRRSTDGGKTWEASRRIAGDGIQLTDNAVGIVDQRAGKVIFLYQKNYMRIFEIESKDDGKTFSQEREITSTFDEFKKDYDWNVVTPGTGHGIQMTNGRLIASIWIAKGKEKADGTRDHGPAAMGTIYSDDHGRTWHRGDIIARDSSEITSPNETVAAQLPNGKVMVNIRSAGPQHLRAAATSDDGISHWTIPRFDPYLFDPICDAGILTVPASSTHPAAVFFSNPDSRDVVKDDKLRFRQNLTLKMSVDNGNTWTHQRVIDPGVSAYSDLTYLHDHLFVIYETGTLLGSESKPDHLVVARVSIDWVSNGVTPQIWKAP